MPAPLLLVLLPFFALVPAIGWLIRTLHLDGDRPGFGGLR